MDEKILKMLTDEKIAKEEKTKKLKRMQLYQNIQKDILDQMERNGTVGKYYADLVDDYMSMWIAKVMCVCDIQVRGVYVPYNNGGGQEGTRKNDSADLMLKINAQMLKLLAELGIKPSQAVREDEEL